MTLVLRRGRVAFDCSQGRLVGVGIDLDGAFDEDYQDVLARRHRDEEGLDALVQLLGSRTETGFSEEEVRRTLSTTPASEDWRIGETIACDVLEGDVGCTFPWPVIRDLKNLAASPAGTDQVGFHKDDKGWRFAFAEVKTSGDKGRPPSVLYGRSGEVRQLLDLVTSTRMATALVVYLGHRVHNAPWRDAYVGAASRWFNDTNDVQLVGTMVRPMSANLDDIRSRAASLASEHPTLDFALFAIYVPDGVFDKIRARLAA